METKADKLGVMFWSDLVEKWYIVIGGMHDEDDIDEEYKFETEEEARSYMDTRKDVEWE
jgi:hypothetical protein